MQSQRPAWPGSCRTQSNRSTCSASRQTGSPAGVSGSFCALPIVWSGCSLALSQLSPKLPATAAATTGPKDMHACQSAHQISGLVPLRQLVAPGWWSAAAAAAQLCHHGPRQPPRLCPSPAASSYAQASSSADTLAPSSKPMFSSRAKIAEACVPWLKGSKNRYSSSGTGILPAAALPPSTPHCNSSSQP